MKGRQLRRSAGVLTPLFSLYSQKSIGVGEFSDLNLLVDWCKKTGLSIIQLLPVNDAGLHLRPYDSESSFALDPVHASLENIAHAPIGDFKNEIQRLREAFPLRGDFYDKTVKKAKLDVLKQIFEKRKASGESDFRRYCRAQEKWLEPYCQFKVLKDRFGAAGWIDWPPEYRDRDKDVMGRLAKTEVFGLEFYRWVQWQLYLQFRKAKEYAKKKGVRIMGDIPFLVSRDSADVWMSPQYFKLELSAGAPPDQFFADGQEWGMPPYCWKEIQDSGYEYVTGKLRYAENFYDLFRIDHFVGVFRVWTFRFGLPYEERRKTGAFDPPDEKVWEDHGRRIVEAMMQSTSMQACAEDLGAVPKCSDRVLEDYGIPGMDVQRWMRHWETTREYKKPSEYRASAIAVLSTHDTSPLWAWWKWEAGDEDERQKFWQWIGLAGPFEAEPSVKFAEASLKTISSTQSLFSIQLLGDWLCLAGIPKDKDPNYRINVPGVVNETNWRQRAPFSLEEMQKLPANKKILSMNQLSGRSTTHLRGVGDK